MSVVITTSSDAETKALGKKIAADLKSGDIIALYGDLGAGKTTFVKGLAEGLGITEDITSPTFTLMNIYKFRSPTLPTGRQESEVRILAHIDTYRLKDERELLAIGAEDYVGQPDTVTVIEWPEKISGFLSEFQKDKAKNIIAISFDHSITNERKITIRS